MTEVTPTGDTLVRQVTPLLGITPHEKTQLQSTNTPKDIEDILGTGASKGMWIHHYKLWMA